MDWPDGPQSAIADDPIMARITAAMASVLLYIFILLFLDGDDSRLLHLTGIYAFEPNSAEAVGPKRTRLDLDNRDCFREAISPEQILADTNRERAMGQHDPAIRTRQYHPVSPIRFAYACKQNRIDDGQMAREFCIRMQNNLSASARCKNFMHSLTQNKQGLGRSADLDIVDGSPGQMARFHSTSNRLSQSQVREWMPTWSDRQKWQILTGMSHWTEWGDTVDLFPVPD